LQTPERPAVQPRPGAGCRFPAPVPGVSQRDNTWIRPKVVHAMGDKLQGKVDQASGKMKEAAGKAGDDESLENEGRREQSKGDLREAAGKVKDAVKR
jgi:uncharacterized protein YjbJ (UPF0337 family)